MVLRCNGKIYRLAILALFLLLAIPSISRAESGLSAGFAPQSIWISRTHVIAGESVNIFTVLYNSSENTVAGEIIFTLDNSSIGTKEFTLNPGEAQTVFLPWVAKAGNHSISARIENALVANTNTKTSVLNQATGNITVSVEAPPPPSPSAQVLNSAVTAITSGVASSAPAVMSALTSLYEKTEALREDAKSALEKQIAESSAGATAAGAGQEGGSAGVPAGTSTLSSETQNSAPFLSTAGKYAALAGLAIVNSKTLFYIALALVLLLLVQMLRVFLRERNREY